MSALECFLAKIGTYQKAERNYLWIESTVKFLCSTRDVAKNEKDKKTVSECNVMAGKLVPKIWKSKTQSKSRKIALIALEKSEATYSLLFNGKTMFERLKHKLRG